MIFDWIIDYLYMFYGMLLMHLHLTPPKHYLGYVLPEKAPIILIPGIASRWGFLKELGDYISLKGHPVYVIQKLGYNFSNIPHQAMIVEEFILEHNLQNVILVTHSKGGLIGKYLLVHHNTEKRIKGLVTIATPFYGSYPTRYIPLRPYKEVSIGSSFINALQEHTGVHKNIISITPAFDNHIWIEEHRNVKGAQNIKLDVKGHSKVVFDIRTKQHVLKAIESLSIN